MTEAMFGKLKAVNQIADVEYRYRYSREMWRNTNYSYSPHQLVHGYIEVEVELDGRSWIGFPTFVLSWI